MKKILSGPNYRRRHTTEKSAPGLIVPPTGIRLLNKGYRGLRFSKVEIYYDPSIIKDS